MEQEKVERDLKAAIAYLQTVVDYPTIRTGWGFRVSAGPIDIEALKTLKSVLEQTERWIHDRRADPSLQ